MNILNRWQYTDLKKGWVGFGSIRLMQDEKQVGELGFMPEGDRYENFFWGSQINTTRIDTSLKMDMYFLNYLIKVLVFNLHIVIIDKRLFMVLEIMILTIRVFIAIFCITQLLVTPKTKLN